MKINRMTLYIIILLMGTEISTQILLFADLIKQGIPMIVCIIFLLVFIALQVATLMSLYTNESRISDKTRLCGRIKLVLNVLAAIIGLISNGAVFTFFYIVVMASFYMQLYIRIDSLYLEE